jgi:hypothetical protein
MACLGAVILYPLPLNFLPHPGDIIPLLPGIFNPSLIENDFHYQLYLFLPLLSRRIYDYSRQKAFTFAGICSRAFWGKTGTIWARGIKRKDPHFL